MLDWVPRPKQGQIPRFMMENHPCLFVTGDVDWSKWRMKTNHNAHKFTGDVTAGKNQMIRTNYNHPDLHRGLFIKNPHMMYLCENGSNFPLLSLDVHAWLLCSYLTGSVQLPTVEVMKKANIQQFLDQLNLPVVRYQSDEAYAKILYSKAGYWKKSDETASEEESEYDDDEKVAASPYDLDVHEYNQYVAITS